MDKYAVIGHPVKHSLSPKVHQHFAQQTGIELEYTAIEAPINEFESTVLNFQHEGGKGLNITAPFKEAAYQFSTQLSEHAELAKSVNCFVLKDQERFGHNVDGTGLVTDLTQNKNINLKNKRLLIIGAGGATRGILAPLLEQAPQEIIIANRTKETADLLVDQFSTLGSLESSTLETIPEKEFDLIIHATSAGQSGNVPNINSNLINTNTLCLDLAYGQYAQPFLNWCKQQGATQTADGYGMLIEQAADSFFLWHGIRPNTRTLIQFKVT